MEHRTLINLFRDESIVQPRIVAHQRPGISSSSTSSLFTRVQCVMHFQSMIRSVAATGPLQKGGSRLCDTETNRPMRMVVRRHRCCGVSSCTNPQHPRSNPISVGETCVRPMHAAHASSHVTGRDGHLVPLLVHLSGRRNRQGCPSVQRGWMNELRACFSRCHGPRLAGPLPDPRDLQTPQASQTARPAVRLLADDCSAELRLRVELSVTGANIAAPGSCTARRLALGSI